MKAIIFDFNRTIYDPESGSLHNGSLECLKSLSEKHTLFLVAKGGEDRKQLIQSLDIEEFFRAISVQEEKNIEQFQECEKMLDADTNWFVVGDRTRKEIKYGNLCGMTTIWFKNGKFAEEAPQNQDEDPNFTIAQLFEIADIINN
ncbi:HAD hydrolase-like protein [Patescibacteria group bacterium]|nr:HAD hydrolase-like protein [Patescibacteria group bacterium]